MCQGYTAASLRKRADLPHSGILPTGNRCTQPHCCCLRRSRQDNHCIHGLRLCLRQPGPAALLRTVGDWNRKFSLHHAGTGPVRKLCNWARWMRWKTSPLCTGRSALVRILCCRSRTCPGCMAALYRNTLLQRSSGERKIRCESNLRWVGVKAALATYLILPRCAQRAIRYVGVA